MVSFTIDKYLKLKKEGKWKKIADETWFDWWGTKESLTNKAKRLAGFTTRIIKKYIPEKDYKKWEIFLTKKQFPCGQLDLFIQDGSKELAVEVKYIGLAFLGEIKSFNQELKNHVIQEKIN